MAPDNTPVFLTETRQKVLRGDYDGEENTERTHKSRIRARAQKAIDELDEVAMSPEIENEDVFDPERVAFLLLHIMRGTGGLNAYIPPKEYHDAMYVEVDQVLRELTRDVDEDD